MNISIITLGCNKNEIDSEMIAGYFKEKGFIFSKDLSLSETILINTCGFINVAKEEAINKILEISDYKIKGIGCLKHLIVVGCLAKRYKKEIYESLPEVDLVIGVDEYSNFDNIFSKYFNLKNSNLCLDMNQRIVSSLYPMAYIRISDGCNNKCHYCAIPLIRGNLKSRNIEEIVNEAKTLATKGIRELVVISQDTTSYGLDNYGEYKLVGLLRELSKIEGIKWIRTLYMYPGKITDELIHEYKSNSKLCKYFDIPIQHISDNILKSMNRHTSKKEIYELIQKIRKQIPEAVIRTTIITGYQGETKKNFNELLQAIKDLKFDKLGAFTFSKEENTVADNIDGDINENIKQDRYNKVMKLQSKIVKEKQKENMGKYIEVLVENVSNDEEYFVCRSYMEAPDVDSKILIDLKTNIDKIIIGQWYSSEIIGASGYDYIAKLRGENKCTTKRI